MMFSEDYVQSMVTARDAAALVQDVERIRVVHERFAAVPTRHWWQRLGRQGVGRQWVGRQAVVTAPGRRGAGRSVEAAATPPGTTAPGATAPGADAAVPAGPVAGSGAGRELAGSRR
jgi:hypothetical protein